MVVLVVLVVVLVVLGVVFLVPVAVARCATFTYTKTTPRSTKTTTRTTKTNKNKTKNKTKTKQKHCLGRSQRYFHDISRIASGKFPGNFPEMSGNVPVLFPEKFAGHARDPENNEKILRWRHIIRNFTIIRYIVFYIN